jgi:hypothetical protein
MSVKNTAIATAVAATTTTDVAEMSDTQLILQMMGALSAKIDQKFDAQDARISKLEALATASVVSTQPARASVVASTSGKRSKRNPGNREEAFALVEGWVELNFPEFDTDDCLLAMARGLKTARDDGYDPPYAVWFCTEEDDVVLETPVVRIKLDGRGWQGATPALLTKAAAWLRGYEEADADLPEDGPLA